MKTSVSPWQILSRRRWVVIGVTAVGLLIAAIAFLLTPTPYAATTTVLLVDQTSGRDPSMAAIDMPVLVKSTTVIERAERAIGIKYPLPSVVADLSAKVQYGSNVMPIIYKNSNPRIAVAFANALADQLSLYYRQISTTRYDASATYLNDALHKQKQHLADLDRALQTAAVKDPYLDQLDATQSLAAQLVLLQGQRSTAEAALTGHQAIAGSAVEGMQSVVPVAKAEILKDDTGLKKLSDQAGSDSAQLTIDRAQYSDSFPGLPGLEEKVRVESQALDVAKNVRSGSGLEASPSYVSALATKSRSQAAVKQDQATLHSLDRAIEQVQDHLAGVPSKGVALAALRRDRDASSIAYGSLYTRLQTTLASQATSSSLGSIQVIDRAEAAYNALAKIFFLLIGGAIFGSLAIGITAAFFLEILDKRLRTSNDVEEIFGIPVLASVRAR